MGDVVDLFTNKIHMDGTDQDMDLLGRTYEYCIAQFAAKEGKDGGEFYTPSSIVKLLVEILKPYDNCRVYDPCCGFRVIIVTVANSLGNIRVFELLPKLKTKKYGWCIA